MFCLNKNDDDLIDQINDVFDQAKEQYGSNDSELKMILVLEREITKVMADNYLC